MHIAIMLKPIENIEKIITETPPNLFSFLYSYNP